jgi:hypothetical protein
MNLTKIALSTIGTAGLVLSGAGVAHASSAGTSGSAAGSLCDIQVSRVEALDIQDNDGLDEIKLRIGDKTSVTRSYFTGQIRNVLGDNTYDLFTSPELVKVVEVDTNKQTTLGSASIPCVARNATSLVSDSNSDAVYKVTWRVTVLVP